MEQIKKKNVITYIVCLILAIGLWTFVIAEVNPITTNIYRNISVEIEGEQALIDRGYAIAGEDSYSVNISVTGTRKDVDVLASSDFKAVADISELVPGQNKLNISVSGPKGVTINEITSGDIIVEVENYVTTVTTKKIFFSDAGQGYEETLLSQGPDFITIKGAASDVAQVSYIRYDLKAEELDRDIIKTVKLEGVAVNSSGNEVPNIDMSLASIELDAVIYSVKNVQFSVVLEGESLYGPEGIESFEYPTAITIKGTSATLSTVNTILSVPINIEGISEDREYTITPDLPKGVMLSRTQQSLTGKLVISEDARAAYEAAQKEQENTTVEIQN